MKITFETTPVIWIHVRGEKPTEEQQRHVPGILARRDGGLVQRLLKFMDERGIYRAITVGHCGAGEYAGGFHLVDAKKIAAWLRKEGCKRTKQVASSMKDEDGHQGGGRWIRTRT